MKRMIKRAAEAVAWALMAPLAYAVKWSAPVDAGQRLFQFGSHLVSLLPGLPGVLLRRAYYRTVLDLGWRDFTIEFGTIFASRGTELGDNCYIGPFCNIGLVRIGRDVLIGSGVHLISGAHVHHIERLDRPIKSQGGTLTKISIGNDVWIGNGALVMNDVGSSVVVGAGAVVTRPCGAFGVYAGNPSRKLRDRRGALVKHHGGKRPRPSDTPAAPPAAYTELQQSRGQARA